MTLIDLYINQNNVGISVHDKFKQINTFKKIN